MEALQNGATEIEFPQGPGARFGFLKKVMLLAKQIKRLPIIHPKGSKRVSEINTRAKNYIEYVNII